METNLFFIVFGASFLVALSGAMSPGPLLTYTIMKTVQSGKHGYLTGLWVITGHAILESAILIALLMGFSFLLKNSTVRFIVSLAGCFFLVYFGVSILVNVIRGKVDTGFIQRSGARNGKESRAGTDASEEAGPDVTETNHPTQPHKKENPALNNPVLGGILVSMSNPYWWLWWASIGSTFLVRYDISITNVPGMLAFFLGHEAGDLAWYLPVSLLTFLGRRHMSGKVYSVILGVCGVFLVIFGVYLGYSSLSDIGLISA